MFRGLFIYAGKLRADLSQHRSPFEIAMGVAMGATLGFLPMDNLVWVMLLVSVLFLPVYQWGALAAWLFAGLLSSHLSFVPDAIGDWLLSWDGVRWFAGQCHALPLGAWFRINNTLVLGSVAVGVILFIPHWIAGRAMARQSQRRKGTLLSNGEIEPVTVYRKVASTIPQIESRIESTSHDPVRIAVAADASSDVAITGMESQRSSHSAARDTETVSVASDTSIGGRSLRMDPPHTDSQSDSSNGLVDQDQVTIRETFIEVIRLRTPQPHSLSPMNDPSNAMILESQQPKVLVPANNETVLTGTAREASPESKDSVITRLSPPHQQLTGPKSSNSLRFLLSHLTSHRGTQDRSESDRRGSEA